MSKPGYIKNWGSSKGSGTLYGTLHGNKGSTFFRILHPKYTMKNELELIAMRNWNGYNNLKNIKNETLIIWGDKDVSYNFEQVDTLNKNISNSRIEIFKGCCHNVHLEQPQKFNETVKIFLE